MQKIETLFKRDFTQGGIIIDEYNLNASWVILGEGVATRKWDGTCTMIRNEVLFKRFDRKLNKKTNKYKDPPECWEPAQEPDQNTGHWPGWVPVGDAPEDVYHREAFETRKALHNFERLDGTYELCGPKINGNPEKLQAHFLIKHGGYVYANVPTKFEELKQWFHERDIEGIVWHHPDGRMLKIKKKDFGLARLD